MIDLAELTTLDPVTIEDRARENPFWLAEVITALAEAERQDRKEMALAYYAPVNPMAAPAHHSTAKEIVLCGGNRSSKSETMLAELAIQMTGIVPKSLEATYPKSKLRTHPIRARVVCNSLTDTLEPVIKPKLRWDQWSGVGDPESGHGHWGWLPRELLAGGTWENAYQEKYRTVKVRHTSGDYSSCQFLSYDQDVSAFAGSSMHFVGHDELPTAAIYRENRMRTLDVQGQIWTAFTPPDEAGASRADVAWFYDEVYEKGLPGPHKDPGIDTYVLWTEQNSLLSPTEIQTLVTRFTPEQKEARLHGKFLHLSGVVYPLFTEGEAAWCFKCHKKSLALGTTCPDCGGDDLTRFSHVCDPHEIPPGWPVLFVIDPHPRKKDACGWFALTPSDDVVMVGELEADGTADEVASQVFAFEREQRLAPLRRLMDPNIATETNDRTEKGWTMRMAYDRVGLRCDLANDSVPLGIQHVNELLRPDPQTRRPRFRAFSTCQKFLYGMTHWGWDEWARTGDKEPKERVRERHKDFPDLLRYLANEQPSYRAITRPQRWHSDLGPRPTSRRY